MDPKQPLDTKSSDSLKRTLGSRFDDEEATAPPESQGQANTFSSLAEDSSTAKLLVDRDGTIIKTNAAAAEMFGRDVDALMFRVISALVCAGDRAPLRHALRDAFDGKVPQYCSIHHPNRAFWNESGANARIVAHDDSPDDAPECSLRVTFQLLEPGGSGSEHCLVSCQLQSPAAIACDSVDEGITQVRVPPPATAPNTELAAGSASDEHFLQTVPYELQGPLLLLQQQLQQLQERIETTPDASLASEALETTNELVNLVDKLVTLAQLESADHQLRETAFSVWPAIDDVVTAWVEPAAAYDVCLQLSQLGAIPDRAIGDASYIAQSLHHVLDNAVRFAHSHVTVATSYGDGQLTFVVSDDGPGIAAADSVRIMDPFVRLSSPDDPPGVGLGLTVANRLVAALGGTLQLTSTPGLGTQVTISLPLALALASQAGATRRRQSVMPTLSGPGSAGPGSAEPGSAIDPASSISLGWPAHATPADPTMGKTEGLETTMSWPTLNPDTPTSTPPEALAAASLPLSASPLSASPLSASPHSDVRQRQPHILIADQDTELRKQLVEIVDGMSISYDTAEDGAEALKQLQHGTFAALIMDMDLPVLDGYATLRWIRQDPKLSTLRVLAMTAGSLRHEEDACLAAGCDLYHAKPDGIDALREQVHALAALFPDHFARATG